MATWYRIGSVVDAILEVEVVAETAASLLIKKKGGGGNARVRKVTERYQYYPTEAQAIEELVRRAQARERQAHDDWVSARKALERILQRYLASPVELTG